VQNHKKTHVTLTSYVSLTRSRLLKAVKVNVRTHFSKFSAAVHELSCQWEKNLVTMLKTILQSFPRTVTNRSRYGLGFAVRLVSHFNAVVRAFCGRDSLFQQLHRVSEKKVI